MVLLCILDGFGDRDAAMPDNAIAAAHTPNIDKLLETCPHTLIDGSGLSVGLPDGQMGNSEVGHLNLGAGRVVYQDISRIDEAIEDGSFFKNEVINTAMDRITINGNSMHLFGLLSDGKVHSSLDHLYALVEMAKQKGVKQVYLHAFLDGRDTPPTSGIKYMEQTIEKFNKIGLGKVSTLGGRYYGMDRDRRWERTDIAFRSIVYGEGEKHTDPIQAIQQSYDNDVTDEFMIPVVIDNGDNSNGKVKDKDLCIIFNFRSDRVRQLSYMLTGHDIKGYVHQEHPKIELVTMTNFDINMFEAKVAFHQIKLDNILSSVLSQSSKKQLRTSETEKYAHITFFFNGGLEEPFEGEVRDMIASPKVATYDLQPEMSAPEVTTNVVKRIQSGEFDFILINFANCDMVGHTGIFDAAQKAVEAVDKGLGKILDAVKEQNGIALVTADHGNAEMMIDPETGGPWTAHTTNLVPFILFDPSGSIGKVSLRDGGILADVAPTVLEILKLSQPSEMTGKSLILKGN